MYSINSNVGSLQKLGIKPFFISDSELKTYWKMNEKSGEIINDSESSDSIGDGCNLDVTGATYAQTGIGGTIGKSLLFDGVNDYAIAGTSKSQFNFMHNSTALFSVSFWMKTAAAAGATHTIFEDNQHFSQKQGVSLSTRVDDKIIFIITKSDNGNYPCIWISTNDYIPDADWHFYCMTYDQSLANTNMVFRRDNANKVTENKTAHAPVDTDSTDVMTIGKDSGNADTYLDGNLQQLTIWNRVLSEAEQTILYNAGNGLGVY